MRPSAQGVIGASIAVACLSLALGAQSPMPSPSNLTIRLEPAPGNSGLPMNFTVVLTNASGHDLLLPVPVVN